MYDQPQAMGPLTLLAYLQFTGFFSYRMLITILVVTICCLPWRPRFIDSVRDGLGRFAQKRGVAICFTGILSFIVTATLALSRGIPVAYVHDEFSYLLSADTLAHGRLTNPTPPVWEPFESEHILVRPSYQSKYQPGQGIFMALGQVIAGQPIWGVWLSAALAAAAMHWALLGWMQARWAFLGAMLSVLHPQLLEWGQRYWGGSVAVLGGALLLGGVGRILRGRGAWPMEKQTRAGRPCHGPAVWVGIGMAVLAISRPYEGFILTIFCAIGATWLLRKKLPLIQALKHILIPIAAVMIPFSLWLCYYNYRVTGHPLRMPYVEHQAQYASVPLFLFQGTPNPPQYRNFELWRFYWRDQRYPYLRRDDWRKIRDEALVMLGGLYQSSLGNVESLTVALLVMPWAIWASRKMRMLVVVFLCFTIALLLGTFMIGHYAAPAAALVAIIVLCGLRLMQRMGPSIGALVVRVAVAVAVLWSIFWWIAFFNWHPNPSEYQLRRQVVQRQIEAKAGKHLLLVHYNNHNPHEEWVYNGADLEGSRIVWAREMSEDINRRLLAHYADRVVWLIEPDAEGKAPTRIREALK